MKKTKKIAISVIAATILFLMLYVSLKSDEDKVVYIDVAIAKREIIPGEKIAKEDVELVKVPSEIGSQYIRDLSLINKYAKDPIYKGQYIRSEQIKTAAENIKDKPQPDIRTVRLVTNVEAYAGVGKGDKFDLIYVGKIGVLETVGRYLYQNLEVKRVLNKSGVDLDKIVADKYNTAELEPGYIDFDVPAEIALEIKTLQGENNNVCFKLVAWTDESEPISDPGYRKSDDIIYSGANSVNSVKNVPKNEKKTPEKKSIQIKSSN